MVLYSLVAWFINLSWTFLSLLARFDVYLKISGAQSSYRLEQKVTKRTITQPILNVQSLIFQ